MITEAEVHLACDAIDARGEEPKYELIRAELQNRGSWSTIKKYRQSWIARDAEVPPVPEALQAHVQAVSAALWRSAYPLAAQIFGEERRIAAAEAAELTAALEHAEAGVADKDTMIVRLTEVADDLRARLAAAEAARRDDAERHATLAGEVAALTATTATLQALLAARSDVGPVLRVVGGDHAREERPLETKDTPSRPQLC